MVNQVAIIDGVTQQIYEKNLRNYPITKVVFFKKNPNLHNVLEVLTHNSRYI